MRATDTRGYLAIAVKTARSAGDYLLKNKTAFQTVDVDSAHDLKLRADRLSEKRIVDHLRKHTPFSILSEESGMLKGSEDGFWWVVDPLDGTINYFHQIPLSCVSIALCYQQRPVLGVIYDFGRKELFTGVVGQGAWLNGRKIRVSRRKYKRQAVLATGFPSQNALSVDDIDTFVRNLNTYRKVRLLGSAALSMAYVAAGRMDSYYEKDIMFWDVAAGVALIKAAGGKIILSSTGREYCYQISAHNGKLRG